MNLIIEEVEETLKKLKNMVNMFKESSKVFDEENTKNALIIPFFNKVLGYETSNPFEFQAEHLADSRIKGNEKVDYSIIIDNEPKVIIEAKRFNAPLLMHFGQLERYFSVKPTIRYGILTNGTDYCFFTDTQHANIMDKEPFYRFNIENVTDEDLDFLKHFTKENMFGDDDALKKYIAKGRLNNYLKGLFEQPTDAFVEFIKQHSHMHSITKKDIQSFGTGLNAKTVAEEINPPSIAGVKMNSTLDLTLITPQNSPTYSTNLLKSKVKTTSIEVIRMDVEFLGHQFTTNKWVDLFIGTFEILIQAKPDLMAKMDKLYPKQKVTKFSYDINDFPKYKTKKLKNKLQVKQLSNGLYVFAGLNANTIEHILSGVLTICGISNDELKVTKHLKDGRKV